MSERWRVGGKQRLGGPEERGSYVRQVPGSEAKSHNSQQSERGYTCTYCIHRRAIMGHG